MLSLSRFTLPILMMFCILMFVEDAHAQAGRSRHRRHFGKSGANQGVPGISSPSRHEQLTKLLGITTPATNAKPSAEAEMPGLSSNEAIGESRALDVPGVSSPSQPGFAGSVSESPDSELVLWIPIAAELNRLRTQIAQKRKPSEDVGAAFPDLLHGEETIAIQAVMLSNMQQQDLDSLETILANRNWCESVIHHLNWLGVSEVEAPLPTTAQSPTNESNDNTERDFERWLSELAVIVNELQVAGAAYTSQLQIPFRCSTAAASATMEPIIPGNIEDIEDLQVSADFRSALKAYLLVNQVFEEVLSAGAISEHYVIQTDEMLKQFEVPPAERTAVWLAAARASAGLGKRECVYSVLKAELQRNQVAVEQKNSAATFLNFKLAWNSPVAGLPADKPERLPFPVDLSTARNLVREGQVRYSRPARDRLRVSARRELRNLRQQVANYQMQVDGELLEKLSHLLATGDTAKVQANSQQN